VQLLRLRSAFEGCDVTFASNATCAPTADPAANPAADPAIMGSAPFCQIPDANLTTKFALVRLATRVLMLVLRIRPDVIVTTGAACGFFALMAGRLVGARGVFVDSIANADALSLSARLVLRMGGCVFTQWPELAGDYVGDGDDEADREKAPSRGEHRGGGTKQPQGTQSGAVYHGAVL
jgi:hypothetical protein